MPEEAALVEMEKAFAHGLDVLKDLLGSKQLWPWSKMSALPPLKPVLKLLLKCRNFTSVGEVVETVMHSKCLQRKVQKERDPKLVCFHEEWKEGRRYQWWEVVLIGSQFYLLIILPKSVFCRVGVGGYYCLCFFLGWLYGEFLLWICQTDLKDRTTYLLVWLSL